jgi:hypothetical protein
MILLYVTITGMDTHRVANLGYFSPKNANLEIFRPLGN